MTLKSYFADSVESAIRQARRELGPDAMLVYSRESHPEARYLGSHEVVFSLPEHPRELEPPPPLTRREEAPEDLRLPEPPALAELSRQVATLRKQMERMASTMAHPRPPSPNAAASPRLTALLDGLVDAGLSAEVIECLAAGWKTNPESAAIAADPDPERVRELVANDLGSMFRVDARLGSAGASPRIAAIVGPPGSGKTTTLVKLAVAYGLKSRKPVQLISMDTWRIGGADQLRSYAAILGVGFQAMETPGALAQALEEHSSKELILIDTPGQSEKDIFAGDGLAAFFRSRPDIDIHLALTASMKPADLRRAVDRYEKFRPAKLLFTRLDETNSPGSILSEAARTAKPISFVADGQQIPEDLREATREYLIRLVLGDLSRTGALEEAAPDPLAALGEAWKSLAGSCAAAA